MVKDGGRGVITMLVLSLERLKGGRRSELGKRGVGVQVVRKDAAQTALEDVFRGELVRGRVAEGDEGGQEHGSGTNDRGEGLDEALR